MINQAFITARFYFLLGIIMLMFSAYTHAGQLPNHYPSAFRWSGTVEEISNNTIVIGDREFTLTQSASFHRLNSYNSTLQDIKAGMPLGCIISDTNQIISLWEFPKELSSTVGPWAEGLHGINVKR
tara:strand:- start:204 stop:581 length:378 start_codon:yes stop_codon:yes gene_type:complete